MSPDRSQLLIEILLLLFYSVFLFGSTILLNPALRGEVKIRTDTTHLYMSVT